MEITDHKEILIVGAGPAGLTLAAALLPSLPTTVISTRHSENIHHSRATGIQPRILTILESLGVLDRVRESAIILGGNTIYVDGEKQYSVSFYDPSTKNPALSLDQRHLEAIIEQRLTTLDRAVKWDTELRDVFFQNNTLIAEVRSGTSIEHWSCGYIVGCDGARSIVRSSTGISFSGITYDEQSFVLDGVVHGDLDSTSMHYFVARESRLVLVPIRADGFFKVSGAFPKGSTPSTDSLRELVSYHSRGRFTIEPITPIYQYPMHARIAQSFATEDRIFLCGDAAHLFPPNGGQGMNVAIEDAYELASLFNSMAQLGPSYSPAAENGDGLFESYHARREEVLLRLESVKETKARYSYQSLCANFNQAEEQLHIQRKEL